LLYGLISFAVLLAINATLTLPGIAGFVLAIGMAVDSNVLVFERIREEYVGKKRPLAAVNLGFRKALSAIGDSNATTVLAAVLLFFLASGAVRGFGITLTVGVVVSIFTALVVTRVLVELLVKIPALRKHPRLLGIESKRKLMNWLEAKQPNVIGHSKIFFIISLVAVSAAAIGLFARDLNYGLEFTGGRLLEYDTERPVNVDQLREGLADIGLPRALVQQSGSGNVSIRSGQMTEEKEAEVRAATEELGGSADKVRDEFIGPSIGNELRKKALIALGLALLAQLAYLAVRFRWNFGLAAVLAMFHDVLILMGIFAWLGKEIDGVFLAALLTVIGYSINDSVVVFDRIRERRRERSSEPLEKVANDACLETFPRTVNTGLGAFFILIALYFLGGESLQDFALALIIGIAVGTYSSVLTAAPLCVLLDRWKPAPVPVRKSASGKRKPAPSSSRRQPSKRR
jgi:SecD/SecF fusion protein